MEIDEWGRPTSVGSAKDRRWAFRWSALGVLTGLTTPGGAEWTHELDEQHRVHRSVDPVGRATATERDEAGLVSSISSGPTARCDGASESSAHGGAAQLIGSSDED